jgi:hypothetical protein
MPLMTGSLSDSPRRLGSGLSSSARRLSRQGFRGAAEKMAYAAETERLGRGGLGRAEDRVIGGQTAERQADALNKLRMQRLMGSGQNPAKSGQRTNDVYRPTGDPKLTPPSTSGSTRSSGGAASSGTPTATGVPFMGEMRSMLQSAEQDRRKALRAETDRLTGVSGEAGSAKEMGDRYSAERAEAIKTAREKGSSLDTFTTRGREMEAINKGRIAAGQKPFEVSGAEWADIDKRDAEAARAAETPAPVPTADATPPPRRTLRDLPDTDRDIRRADADRFLDAAPKPSGDSVDERELDARAATSFGMSPRELLTASASRLASRAAGGDDLFREKAALAALKEIRAKGGSNREVARRQKPLQEQLARIRDARNKQTPNREIVNGVAQIRR